MPRNREKKNPKGQFKTLHVESGSYRTTIPEKFQDRKPYIEKNPKQIEAFIPGVIQNVLVKEGDVVMEGDTLLVLEAMKMRNRIVSPIDGTVGKIFVKINDRVPKNFLLLEFK
jgi:biotin carboxyl carrier protein